MDYRPTVRQLESTANIVEKTLWDGWESAVEEQLARGLGWLGRPTLERRIGEEFAKKILLPGDKEIAAVIHALRITGVWVCLPNGVTYVLARCPCFESVAKDKTEEELKKVLEKKLDVLEF
ncbi:MAG: hypothetical protein ACRDTA_21345 [Pseudonocardiaceae bacterium]